MAIAITVNLEPMPRKTAVPGKLTLLQRLISDQPSELSISEFRLADGHDIWFELPDGTPSKSLTFQRSTGTEESVVSYGMMLVRSAGTPLDGTVGIDQTLTDESGIQIPDHCTVVIL